MGMVMMMGLLKDDGTREDSQKIRHEKIRPSGLSLKRPRATKMTAGMMGPARTYLLTTNRRCPDGSMRMGGMWEETQEGTVVTAAMGNN